MTPARFCECLDTLIISQAMLAKHLRINPKTVAHWASGRTNVDRRVAAWLEDLMRAHETVGALPREWDTGRAHKYDVELLA